MSILKYPPLNHYSDILNSPIKYLKIDFKSNFIIYYLLLYLLHFYIIPTNIGTTQLLILTTTADNDIVILRRPSNLLFISRTFTCNIIHNMPLAFCFCIRIIILLLFEESGYIIQLNVLHVLHTYVNVT